MELHTIAGAPCLTNHLPKSPTMGDDNSPTPHVYWMQSRGISSPLSPRALDLGSNDGEATSVSNGHEFDRKDVYEIRVKGVLDKQWRDWFDGFSITPQGDDQTLLSGRVADQAALHGVLAKIRDLGLPLLLVRRIEKDTDSAD